mmetsp:Transcript_31197/g.56590  ORF Transcript_31197/g.56590 Transcript_31197/m.56590 type:complete len:82 (-) Transcript_31197:155-400(-)
MRAAWIFLLLAVAVVAGSNPGSSSCGSDKECLGTSEAKRQKPAAASGFGLAAKGAKQHSLLQVKTKVTKVMLPPEEEEPDA